jgi:monoamine oxidase
VAEGPWAGRAWGAASEWSPEFPGYLAGAVDAAERAVQALLRHRASAPPEAAARGG